MQQQSTSLCDTKYKIVFLGSMGVGKVQITKKGKTSIIERFVKDQFDSCNNPTVGIDFLSKNISFLSTWQTYLQVICMLNLDKVYRLQLWDTAGQQKYKSLVPAYLRDANCAVFVFDFLRKQTLQGLKNWIQLYHDHSSQSSVTFLFGNKCDVFDDVQILATIGTKQNLTELQEDAIQFARKQGMTFMKISAKTGKNVLNSFQSMIMQLQRGKKVNENQVLDDHQTRFENQVLQKMEKLHLQDTKQGKQITGCCYI